MNKRTPSLFPALLIIFFAGFTFLIYEVSWFRMLSLAIGATVSASTLVLVGFMAGFGLGAHYWGRKSLQSGNQRKLLVSLFLVAGILGLTDYYVFSIWLPGAYAELQHLGLSYTAASLLIFLLALVLLFIPAFFMGGILPLAGKLTIRSDSRLNALTGTIYAFETLGSALGGLAAGFFLIGIFGQKASILFAVALNVVLAILTARAGIFSVQAEPGNQDTNPQTGQTGNKTQPVAAVPALSDRLTALTGTTAFGFAVIGLQIVWFRIFRIYLTNTSYTFSLIASMVILGLSAGSWYYRSGSRKGKDSATMFRLLIIAALAVIAGFLILIRLPELIMFPIAGREESYFLRIILIPVISALLVIIPLTFISGYAFPLACNLLSNKHEEIGNSIGQVLVWNTAGSVAGPILAAFVLIPLIGSGLSVLFFALILTAAAYLIARNLKPSSKLRFTKGVLITGGSILIIILAARPLVYILPPSFTRFDKKILAYKESVEGTYVVGEETNGRNTVLSTYVNNSAVIGSSYDAIKVVKMVGHLPFFTGLRCKNVLVVGFGIGVTTSAIAAHPEVESIDCVELVSGLKDVAHYYDGLNNNIQNDKRLKIHSGDGRHYLQSTVRKFDLISSDPTHPILGSGNLYSKAYFELCKAHLNPGGMVSQYLPLHKLLLSDFLGIIKTFHSVFPNSTIWLGQYHAVLLGANGPLKIDFAKWSENIAASVKDPYFYSDPYHVAACMVLDSLQIEQFPSDIRILTDDHSYVEFFRLKSFEKQNLPINLDYLNKNRGGIRRVFFNIPDDQKLDRFIEGNKLLTSGLSYDLNGNRPEYLNYLRKAVNANPEDEEYPFLIRFNFGRY